MTIPTQGIDAATLDEQHRNALALLVNLSPVDLARLKNFLHLGLPALVGPTTVGAFADVCAKHGLDLSAAGVASFKGSHGLDTAGPNEGAIGPSTAAAWTSALLQGAPAPDGTPRHITARGRRVIENNEGLRLHAYQDQVGVWTIGYGHTAGVFPGQVITQETADALMSGDVAWAERAVSVDVRVALTDNQFDALVDLTFNIGAAGFAGSHVLSYLNEGRYQDAADAFLRWNKGEVNGELVEIPALTERRREGRALFLA